MSNTSRRDQILRNAIDEAWRLGQTERYNLLTNLLLDRQLRNA